MRSQEGLTHRRACEVALRQRWRDAGACPYCGTPVVRFKLCLRHRQAFARRQRAYHLKRSKRSST